MTVDTLHLILAVIALVGACTVWIVGKVVRLEAEVHILLLFRTNMENRMIDLMIDVSTPELDKLLLRFKRGDAMTDEEWLQLHDLVEHYHVESIRDPGGKDPSRKVSLAIFLAALESRQKQQVKGKYRWYRGLTRTFFGLFRRKNSFLV